MSSLLNNNKKKLLDRGPKIKPEEEFTLTDNEEVQTASVEPVPKRGQEQKNIKQNTTTTVRVEKNTRSKLNALVQLGKAENVDVLIDILVDEYIDSHLVKEEKKAFEIIIEVLRKKDRF